jgi:ATP-dependent protease ClpP protease subunit
MKIKGLIQLRRYSAKGRLAAAIRADGAVTPDWELLVYGDIGDSWDGSSVTAKDVATQLEGVKGGTLLVRINSYGGSVSDGSAIYNAIRATGARVITRVEGVAASVASLIAMAGDEVQMSGNTLMMIHAPWTIAYGNSVALRQTADVLDTFAKAMATNYARKTGHPVDQELALLTDGQDHWYTAADAKAAGYADTILDETLPPEEAAARAKHVIAAMARFKTAPAPIAASIQPAWVSALAGFTGTPANPAAPAANTKESLMNWKAIARALGLNVADDADEAAIRGQIAEKLGLKKDADEAAIATALGERANAALTTAVAGAAGGQPTREQQIESMFAIALRGPRANDTTLTLARDTLLIDASQTVEQARAQLLKLMGNGANPLATGHVARVGSEDEVDKRRAAMSQAVLARVGAAKVDGANEFRGMKMLEIARACLEASGVNTRGKSQTELARMALGMRTSAAGGNTTSDFPVVLENTMHKLVLTGFQGAPQTWQQFCKQGDVSDFREWKRLVPGLIGNLDPVNEKGEYKSKNLPDASANSITATRKGNIVRITPEVLINDDIGYVQDMATGMGAAGGRTIERYVYALLASNPTLKSDSIALFHASHGNLAGAGGVPSVVALDAARQAMSVQKAPGEDAEYLDIKPSIAVAHTSVEGLMRVIIGSTFDPDANNKLQRQNMVVNLVKTIVGTPRVATGGWYTFADPNVAPVIEVVFLDGQREPILMQEDEFSTGGLAWRIELPFGVGAIDYRGGYYNPGS